MTETGAKPAGQLGPFLHCPDQMCISVFGVLLQPFEVNFTDSSE